MWKLEGEFHAVVFGGNDSGKAASLWNIVANNGSKHRD